MSIVNHNRTMGTPFDALEASPANPDCFLREEGKQVREGCRGGTQMHSAFMESARRDHAENFQAPLSRKDFIALVMMLTGRKLFFQAVTHRFFRR